MKTFETLEEAILQMANLTTKKNFRTGENKNDMNLARFDCRPVQTFAKQINKGIAFTDRQMEFVTKLIHKYRKQWRKNGYDVESIVESQNLLQPIRSVIRGSWVDIEHDKIVIRFLYDPKIVTKMYEFASSTSAGSMTYDKPNKIWRAALTEENLELVRTFANSFDFSLTAKFQAYANSLVPYLDYKIQLRDAGEYYEIQNAPQSMLDWIAENIGEIQPNNIDRLCALSANLGFTVADSIKEDLKQRYGKLYNTTIQRISHVIPDNVSISELIKYIGQVNPKTIVIYIPDRAYDTALLADELRHYFGQDIVSNLTNDDELRYRFEQDTMEGSSSINGIKDKHIIMCHTGIDLVPEMLISFTGFMFGPSRKSWVNSAGKVIYYCDEIQTGLKKKVYDLR